MKPNLMLLLSLLIFSSGCEFPMVNGPTPNSPPSLPPISKEGKNVFGCKINGEVFVAESSPDAFYESEPIDCVVYRDTLLNISGSSFRYRTAIYLTGILEDRNQQKVGLYSPNLSGVHKTHFTDNGAKLGGLEFYIEDNSNDSIHFIRNDPEVMAGTFEFIAINKDRSDTLFITEGRFDIPLKK